jgi:hypothetical protein
VSEPVSVLGWPGRTVTVTAQTQPTKGALAAGATIGTISTGVGSSAAKVTLRTAAPLAGPGPWWRLTR